MDVTSAVVVGISPSMAPSAALLAPLTVRSTCKPARTTIFTVTAILKVTVTTSTRERCKWDSGLEVVTLATRMLMHTQAGRPCPGSSLKRFQKSLDRFETSFSVKDIKVQQRYRTVSFNELQLYINLLLTQTLPNGLCMLRDTHCYDVA